MMSQIKKQLNPPSSSRHKLILASVSLGLGLSILSVDVSWKRPLQPFRLLVAKALPISSNDTNHEQDQQDQDESLPFIVPNTPHSKPSESDTKALTVTDKDKGINAFATDTFSKEDILVDKSRRVPEVFHVPADFEKRVSFWFDIYTKYGSNIHLFHHAEYPWVIFKFIDTTPIWSAPTKTKNPWTPFHRVEKYVKKEREKIFKVLQSLAKKAAHPKSKLTDEEVEVANTMKDIPGKRVIVYRQAVHSFRSQMGQRDFFKLGLINSSKYLARMEEIFAKYDLPVELTRLPLVESSFNEKAISKVGASGIWQFMPSVGKTFLNVGETVDERNSPLKATEAAARLFLQDFRIFKSWPLAITAYNHGAGGILKATRSMKTHDLGTIIRKYQSRAFQFASRNFYSNFIAALHAERYQNEVFGQLLKVAPLLSDTIKLHIKTKASNIASIAGMTMEELRLYNPDLKAKNKVGKFELPKGYNLHLPEGRSPRIELFQLQARDSQHEKKSKRSAEKVKRVTINFDSKKAVNSYDGIDQEDATIKSAEFSVEPKVTQKNLVILDFNSPWSRPESSQQPTSFESN